MNTGKKERPMENFRPVLPPDTENIVYRRVSLSLSVFLCSSVFHALSVSRVGEDSNVGVEICYGVKCCLCSRKELKK